MRGHVLSLLMACIHTAAQAEPFDTFQDCPECPEMIELPLGEFMMGAPEDEFRTFFLMRDDGFQFGTPENPIIIENEGPQHRVVVDIPIAIAMSEVTFDEWMACVEDGGCNGHIPDNVISPNATPQQILRALIDPRFVHTASEVDIHRAFRNDEQFQVGGQYPVMRVSSLDAMAYTQWLNEKLGTDAYRLPTEAEWEYAARAGTTSRFSQGYEPTVEQANISGAATAQQVGHERPDLRTLGYPVPVDELDAANPWGLRHMSGNVRELTLSCYSGHSEPLPPWSTTREWLEMSVQESCDRVVRGGDLSRGMLEARVAWRTGIEETLNKMTVVGFRIVKELELE